MSDKFQLGKLEYVPDPRTIPISQFIRYDTHVPGSFDFDKSRRPLPLRNWGNDQWQNAVLAAQASQILRFERLWQRQTILLTDSDVISWYRSVTGSVSPGDTRDQGVQTLDMMKLWKNQGWPVTTKTGVKNYTIDAYGELEPNDRAQLRAGCYTMHGIYIGFWLPLAAQEMTLENHWYFAGQSDEEWQAGSWGSFLAYSKAYDRDGFEILAWGRRIWVSNEFIERYADEAWATIAAFADWRTIQSIDVEGLQSRVDQISRG